MKIRIFAGILFVAAALSVTAIPAEPFYSVADGYTGPRNFATLYSSSSSSSLPDYGYTNPYSWGGVQIDGTYDCLVTSNKTIYVFSRDSAFLGHSLQFGTSDDYSSTQNRGTFYLYARFWGNPFTLPGDLIFVYGRLRLRYDSISIIRVPKVSVRTPKSHPLEISCTHGVTDSSSSVYFDSPVEGSSDAGILINNTDNALNFDLGVTFAGDMSQYYGDITVTSAWHDGMNDYRWTTLSVTNTTVGGKIRLGGGSKLAPLVPGEGFTVHLLEFLDSNAMLVAKVEPTTGASGGIHVDTAVSRPASGKVKVVVWAVSMPSVSNDVAVLTVPIASDLTVDDFELAAFGNDSIACSAGLTMRDDPGGSTKTLYALCDYKVTMILSDSSSRYNEGSSALTNMTDGVTSQWSDGLLPHSRAHYHLTGTSSANMMNLRSYDSLPVQPGSVPSLDYIFPGESLVLNDYGALLLFGRSFECNKVDVSGKGVAIAGSIFGPSILRAPLHIDSAAGMISLLYFNSHFTIDGEISGAGAMTLYGHKGSSTSTPGCSFYLSGLNTNYTGSVTLSQTIDYNTTTEDRITPQFDPALNKFATLYVSDGRNLGGATELANPKAVTIQNMCRLALTNAASVTIDEPTRGIFINWVGRFFVKGAGETLTVKSPLAVYGSMHKEGDGLLVLGNPQPTFGPAATGTVPDADATNRVFVVNGGNVEVASAYALNGLDVVSESADSKFIIDTDTEDATLGAYGIINILTPGTPFAVRESATTLNVALKVADEPAWRKKTVGICTVKAADADSVGAILNAATIDNLSEIVIVAMTAENTTIDEVPCVTFKASVAGKRRLILKVK